MNSATNPGGHTEPQRRLHLLYHELRASGARYSYVASTELFQRHLDLYARLREEANPLQPEITFDDGHISNLELAAPLLEQRGLTARFFITVGWTGAKPGYMGWAELASLARAGHAIGAHGWSHKLLTHCTDRELSVELGDARLKLEEKLGSPVTTMSLPGGRANGRVLAACERAGYTTIYTSAPQAEPLPLGRTVGRLNILGDMQPEWIAQLFAPSGTLLDSLGRQYRRKQALKKLLGDRLYARLWALANRKEPETDGGGAA